MTFFHFVNCVALSFVPYFFVYKHSGLAEYAQFWKCVQAGAAYLLTQLAKMLLLATFFPASDTSTGFDFIGDILKCTVDLADLIGFYLVITKVVGRGQLKFLVAGLGWASAELIMTRSLPLWMGARGIEFDWKYIQLSLESNINLAQHIATSLLVWLYSRHDLNRSFFPLVASMLVAATYRPILFELLGHLFGVQSWLLLFVKFVFTLSITVGAFQMYLGLTSASSADSNHYHHH